MPEQQLTNEQLRKALSEMQRGGVVKNPALIELERRGFIYKGSDGRWGILNDGMEFLGQ